MMTVDNNTKFLFIAAAIITTSLIVALVGSLT
jgi:hypothetical protein